MIHDSVLIQVRRIVATRIVVSLIFMAPLLLTGASLLSCTKSDSNRSGVDDWMDVSVDGDVSVSLWRTDGEPLGYYETNTPPAGSSVQHFDIYTSNPVIIRLEVNQDGPVKMDVIAWHLRAGGIMGSKLEEVEQHVAFALDEPAGTRVELIVAHDDDFRDLALQIDRDADGTVDAEQPPASVTDEE